MLGVLLAGGRSVRMGRCKALLPWGERGEPMWLAGLRALDAVCAQVVVAPGPQRDVAAAARERGVEVLEDLGAPGDGESSVGPLGAIAAGLERARSDGLAATLALACDMPRVGAGELRPLLEAVLVGGHDAAMWRVEGRDQPLCAAYGPRCGASSRAALARGARRVVALLEPDATGRREISAVRLVPDRKSEPRLLNVNTPSDYDLGRNGLP